MAMTTSLKEMSLGESTYLLHHVFLPPKLPQSEDYNPEYEQSLLESVIRNLQKFSSLVPDEDSDILVSTANAMSCLRDICEHDGSIDQAKLKKSLGYLNDQDGLLPIYVREQNAGIIMSSNEDTIQFESFELSPRNEDVMSTSGRLQRVFPGPGLALDRATFNERGFQSAIAQPIALMSHQSVAGTKEKIAKAHQEHDEDRDTTNPKMVTSFIMTILRPRSTDSEWLQIHKNTREEVLWRDCRMPWRRSAFWLFIRVVVQIVIRRRSRGERENDLFKEFMIYFMSQVVSKCDEKMPRESVYLMCAKIGRRMRKLNLTTEPAWFDSVQLILRQASSTVEAKWREIRAKNERKLRVSSLGKLEFRQDTHFRLPILDQYLHEIDPRNRESPEDSAEYQPVSNLLIYPPSELPQILITNHPEDTPYNLHSFENWVAFNLDEWLRCHKADEDTCGLLDDLMTRYHTAAFACHSQNPEAVSVMLLTLLELWIACDKSALYIYPILSDYDPFIPVNILQSLVLPLRSQMTRLARAEQYLRDRSSNQKHHGPGVFTDFGTESSFSVRYFDQSEDLQLLLDKIRSHAVQERRNKVSELRQKQKMYQNLQSLAGQERCEYYDVQVTTRRRKAAVWQTRHRLPCSRCSHLSTARSLEIELHEWPLLSDKLEAKSTVFELRVPRAFSHWRDATMFFLLDVLRMEYRSGRRPVSKNTLRTYSGLSNFFQTSREGNPRIFLLSEVKPHERTHRKKKPIIDVTENDIFLKNGLRLQYFDGQVQNFVGDIQSTVDVPKICNYRLPEQSSCLQQFLFRPPQNSDGLSPNTVISSQNSAPADMRLEEYRALAAMPLGVQIQWQNILLQLASSAVNFRKVETSIFFLQIMNQAGPPTDSELRQGHKILEDERFLMAMLDRIDEVLQRIKENWELVQGLCGLIFLVEKILSFSCSKKIQEYCMLELSQFRETAFRWITLIRMMVGQAADEAQKVSLIGRVVHLAFVCAETFNVEEVTGIIADPSSLSVLIQCCILIHDWKLSLPMDSDPLLPILHHRWEVSMYRYHPILANSIIQQQNAGLDMALNSAWPAFKQQSGWSRALNGVDSWMVTRASPLSSNCKDMIVHFNLLTGQLLVNGLPMARLSPDYESHRAYNCLFGKCQLDVMPSDLQGMKFSARKRHMDHVIHLGKKAIPDSEEWDLLVEANKGNETWRFVSPRIFASAFPDAFSEGYAHWYNSNKGYVEFRPIQNPWESSISNWILRKDQSNDTWCLEKDEICLINPSSSTAKLISQTFAPVEMQRKLHCFMKRASSALEIDLPRLRLKFTLSPGSSVIRSCQYPGISVDANQSFGSLIGLQDKLVLVHTKTGHRLILVPEGKVTLDRKHEHVEIKVGWQSRTNVHSYSVDEELGRITDNGSIQSKLLLVYLHALTSFCLPDPLTKLTGTEQALSILRSASLRSFDKLRPENRELLTLIAKLSPRRSYYPQDKEVMQCQMGLCPGLAISTQRLLRGGDGNIPAT